MKCRIAVSDPDKVDATLEITMSVGEWKRLREQLKNEWPSCDLSMEIQALVRQVSQVLTPKPEASHEPL